MDKPIDAKMPANLFRKLAKLFSRLAKLFLKLEKNLRTSYVSVQIRLTVFLIQLSYFFKPSKSFSQHSIFHTIEAGVSKYTQN